MLELLVLVLELLVFIVTFFENYVFLVERFFVRVYFWYFYYFWLYDY